jgi:hypothetical protein
MSSVVISGDTSGSITLAAPAVSGTNTITLPAATGTVMVSGNMPAFRATKSSAQTISNNTTTKITFDTETFDTNNNFASNTFTPTVAGYYQVNLSYSATSLTVARTYSFTPYIYRNGSSYTAFEQNITSVADTWGGSVSSLVYCNGTSDYIEAYFYQNNTPAGTINLSGTASTTQFSAVLVRGA